MVRRIAYLIPSLLLLGMCSQRALAVNDSPAKAVQSDTVFLEILKKFYSAWNRQDEAAILRLWNVESSYRPNRLDEMRREWTSQKASFTNVRIQAVTERSWGAILNTSVDVHIVQLPSKKESNRHLVREFTLHKEGESWTLWNYPSPPEDLAEQLIRVGEAERRTLLEEDKEQVTPELVRLVLAAANKVYGNNEYTQSKGIFELAGQVAIATHDNLGVARSLEGIGHVSRGLSDYPKALEYYQKALAILEAAKEERAIADIHETMGRTYLEMKNAPLSIECNEKALRIFERIGDPIAAADLLEKIGNIYYDQGDFKKAAESYQKKIDLGVPVDNASTLVNLGNSYWALDDPDRALNAYSSALPQVERSGDNAALAGLHTGLGNVFYRKKMMDSVLNHYQKAYELTRTTQNQLEMALAAERLGHVYSDLQNFPEAMIWFQRTFQSQKELGSVAGTAGALVNIAQVHFHKQEYDRALERFEEALKLDEKISDKTGRMVVLQNMARVYYDTANYAAALECYQQGLPLAEAAQNKSALSNILLGIGLVKTLFGESDVALDYYRRSIEIARELGDKAGLAAMLNNIAVVYASRANYGMALENYQGSLEISQELNDRLLVARTLGNIGLAHNSLGNYDEAMDKLQKALAIGEDLKQTEDIARVLGYIGGVHYSQGRFDQALELFQKSLSKWEILQDSKAISATLSYIGDTHFRKKEFSQALEAYEKSLEFVRQLQDEETIPALLSGIANAHLALGHGGTALEFAEQAVELAKRTNNPEILWYASFKAGQAHRQLNDSEKAVQALTGSILQIEELRTEVGSEENKIRFLEGKSAPYSALFELLVEKGDLWEAFAIEEGSRMQTLAEIMSGYGRYVSKGLNATEQEQERKLRSQVLALRTRFFRGKQALPSGSPELTALERQWHQAQTDYLAYESRIIQAHPQLAIYRGQMKVVDKESLALSLLRPGTALLEYVTCEDTTYLIVIVGKDKSGPQARLTASARNTPIPVIKIFRLSPDSNTIAQDVLRYRQLLLTHNQEYQPESLELFEDLIGPARSLLAGKKHLKIIPDGGLWNCPFAALEIAQNRFIIEEATVSYSSSLTVAAEQARLKNERKNHPSTVANLMFTLEPQPSQGALEDYAQICDTSPSEVMAALAGTAAVLKQVQLLQSAKVFRAEKTRESLIKPAAEKSRILQFSVPAFIDDLNPLFSPLLLTEEE
ncbi:MAG TPA: tetratricopeptide repeat protein, partial [Terriglobia bacterium]|nr:tetratricopeptide repeat protein [Terriglobia bacterium]